MVDDVLARELGRLVQDLGFELVELESAGSPTRPVIRLRVDWPDSAPGHGVTIDDCAHVSRAAESLLDERLETGGRYVIEVSSPGVERPLVRPRDFERFAGREVVLKGHGTLLNRARRLQGELLGMVERGGEECIRLRLSEGEEVEVPRREVARAHLVFRWGDER
jgi:ribosome maturation factor RimP